MAGSDSTSATERFHDRSGTGSFSAVPNLRRADEGDLGGAPFFDESSAAPDSVDVRYLYELILSCAAREEERGKALDTKITSLLAGVVAFIGFSFRLNTSIWSAASAFVYLIPLAVLLNALLTQREARAPSAESLQKYFPRYPVTTIRDAIAAMTTACSRNELINGRKATRLTVAALLTAGATVAILVEQVVLDLVHP